MHCAGTVPFIVEGVIVTVFDLAIPEIKVAVMYDGAHHGERKQRNKDSSITLKMIRGDWTPCLLYTSDAADD